MICKSCNGNVVWVGPIAALTHTECEYCNAINNQVVEVPGDQCAHGNPSDEECDQCADEIEDVACAEVDDEPHCIACNDSGEGSHGDTRCTECSPRKRNRDEP